MLNYDLIKLAQVCNGVLIGENIRFKEISIDSRQMNANALFVPIKGDRFNGHDFIQASFNNGAIACLSEKKIETNKPYVLVNDARKSLGQFAAYHRKNFKNPVLGLTGSLGKTTTKALIAAILRQSHEVLAPEISMNNDIGLPLTLLNMSKQDFAVIEMGTNHFGEISYLTQLTKPDVALITNIGAAHLEFFKDLAGVAKEKATIFSGLKENGIAIINADDPYSREFTQVISSKKVITFGYDSKANVKAENVRLNEMGQASFNLIFNSNKECFSEKINLQCYGEHNVKNALAATAMVSAFNIPSSEIKAGLESIKAVNKRLMRRTGLNDSVILDDSYSAIPEAVVAALKVLSCAKGKKVFVFGGMAELNPEQAKSIHQSIGEQAKQLGVDELIVIGELAKHTAASFGNAKCFNDKFALIDYAKTILKKNVTVLVKGSRSMRLEDVVAELVQMQE